MSKLKLRQSGRPSRKATQILAGTPRCIYCSKRGITVEHMPPRIMFRKKHRPGGMEFPSCMECNHGSRAADAAAAFFARLDAFGDDPSAWKIQEALKPFSTLQQLIPGFYEEFFDQRATKQALLSTPGGVLMPVEEIHVGPISQALVSVFAAKLGMAYYREHIGVPLPCEGGVYTLSFLNAGMQPEQAEALFSVLPMHNTLKQGERKSATGQYDYRYNTDEKSVVAALSHFHGNLHLFTLAAAQPELFELTLKATFSGFVKPGELLTKMPKPPSAILMPNDGVRSRENSLLVFPSKNDGRVLKG
jgi:hypothetical protein